MQETKGAKSLKLSDSIYIAGHTGLVGSAILRRLKEQGFTNLFYENSHDLDLRDRNKVFEYIGSIRPDYVVLAAAKVGGILANSRYPTEFISQNLQIQVNVLDAALRFKVNKLLFLGSSCIYPKFARQPIAEEALLTGLLEETNEAYAIAKIAGIKQVQAVRAEYGLPWISAMPTNLYGPNDNFSPTGSHVMPALVRRYVEAQLAGLSEVTNWGSGKPRREFLHSSDLADACIFLLSNYDEDIHINVGSGVDHSIREIAEVVAKLTGYNGSTTWDTTKPDGTPQKLLDISRIRKLGWEPKIGLHEGITQMVNDFKLEYLDGEKH